MAKTRTGSNKLFNSKNNELLFDKSNYLLIVAGAVLIIIGFMMMVGGASNDPEVFNADEIYSFRRITLAPILVIAGFLVEVVAIMKKPSKTE